MTKLLIRLADKGENKRSSFAVLSAVVCIICNILLCGVKFAIGALVGSVSVTADAVNNLSDSAVNIVTLLGTKLSDKPEDKEHPFGHGRIEYISALIVAVSVFVVSFELAKTSVTKIIHPQEMKFSAVYVAVLSLTVLIKLWMAYFNNRLYHLTDNINLKAVRQDSVNDCLVTGATIVSLVLSQLFHFSRLDGIIGLAVSLFIFYSGVGILRQVVSPLLGEAPSKELTDKIEQIICESDIVLGVHDLVIHSYGENKKLASADAEVDAQADVFAIHNAIDQAEKRIFDELNIVICIHMDPIDKTDIKTEKYRLIFRGIISDYNSAYSFHDFILSETDGALRVTFELVVPVEDEGDREKITSDLKERFAKFFPDVVIDFSIEHSYINEKTE